MFIYIHTNPTGRNIHPWDCVTFFVAWKKEKKHQDAVRDSEKITLSISEVGIVGSQRNGVFGGEDQGISKVLNLLWNQSYLGWVVGFGIIQ